MAKNRDRTDDPWTIERELQLFRRVKRLISEVPSGSWPRAREYLIDLLQGHRPTITMGQVPDPMTKVSMLQGPTPQTADDNDPWPGTGALR